MGRGPNAKSPTRREVLLGGAASAIGRAGAPSPFRHRGYLGWVVDIDPRPEPDASWPSIRLDEPLLDEYRRTFRLMRQLRYNEAVVWGLYVGRAWPTAIPSAVTPGRARLVHQLIDAAHAENLKLIGGLGVFSWGFEEIIRSNPALGPTNPKAMCASNPDAWGWMEKVAGFFMTRFPLDGVSMQSADQGRCTCAKCGRWNDDEYHVRINIRMADFFRAHNPRWLVAVSGWGIHFNREASLPLFVEMGKRLDYIIDVVDSAGLNGDAYRRRLIAALPCDFGTIGGPLVEPPLHWDRERWFLPTVRAQGRHLQALARDGGRACEYFNHIRANPGDEVSFHVAGQLLSDVETPWEQHLRNTLEELYGVRGSTAERLAALFIEAEAAYMDRIQPFGSGDISMEPLEGSRPGPAVYLKRLDTAGRAAYTADMARLAVAFRKIAPEVRDQTRMARILRCLENARKDAAQ